MTYNPTENVDNYYQAKGSPQSQMMETTEDMNKRADYAVQAEQQAVQEKTEAVRSISDALELVDDVVLSHLEADDPRFRMMSTAFVALRS